MRRRIVHPFGSSIPASRAFSLLVGLVVLWVLYDSVRQPASWHWLAAQEEGIDRPAAPPPELAAAVPQAPVVAGPNDLDPAAWAKFDSLKELITDKTPLREREMIAYWQLLGWSRTQPLAEFEQRSRREPALTQIWEEPHKYRGKPIRLRLHLRRVLEWESENNPLGVPKLYEAMGWTDESKSLPYTVVFTEKPPELPVGNHIEAEVVFVGYFLKIMTYTAMDDTKRGTPLLMGQLRMLDTGTPNAAVGASGRELLWLVLGGLLLMIAVAWLLTKGRRRPLAAKSNPITVDPEWVPFSSDSVHAKNETEVALIGLNSPCVGSIVPEPEG